MVDMLSTDITWGVTRRKLNRLARKAIRMARLASLRANNPVPLPAQSNPTVSISGSLTISPGATRAPADNSEYIGFQGGAVTAYVGNAAFFSGLRSNGKFRFTTSPINEIEFRIKRVSDGNFGFIVDGQLILDDLLDKYVSGLTQDGDQWLKLSWGANTTTYKAQKLLLQTAGAGYTAGDVVTLSGGTFTTAATVVITSVDGSGKPTNFAIKERGTYSVYPTGTLAVTGGTGTNFTTKVLWDQVFSTLAPRRIEFIPGPNAYLAGVRIDANSSMVAWRPAPSSPRVVITSDSFVHGLYASNPARSLGWQLAYRLGVEDNAIMDGLSGAGFTALNSQPSLASRATQIAAWGADCVIVLLGANDEQSSVAAATIQAAVTAGIEALHAADPDVIVVVASHWFAGYTAYVGGVAAGVAAVADQSRVRFINLFSKGVYTLTTGNNPNGTSGRMSVMNEASQNIHPGDGGIAALATMLAPPIAEMISQMALDMLQS